MYPGPLRSTCTVPIVPVTESWNFWIPDAMVIETEQGTSLPPSLLLPIITKPHRVVGTGTSDLSLDRQNEDTLPVISPPTTFRSAAMKWTEESSKKPPGNVALSFLHSLAK
eukprot:CAMPEP_0113930914 /NCGR_PEP_ID=MMETSP1159-20121227/6231_1 /TAXON_ID=88271 /ORGANISM="Picocystis salinarum" /LENGTH=110 /DNA_ID=CAMNT_0000931783 /DNA_START=407 /DNA_END=739 /DNA_ORIENTATION=- /assembly_acc=CAM_ASM_000767